MYMYIMRLHSEIIGHAVYAIFQLYHGDILLGKKVAVS